MRIGIRDSGFGIRLGALLLALGLAMACGKQGAPKVPKPKVPVAPGNLSVEYSCEGLVLHFDPVGDRENGEKTVEPLTYLIFRKFTTPRPTPRPTKTPIPGEDLSSTATWDLNASAPMATLTETPTPAPTETPTETATETGGPTATPRPTMIPPEEIYGMFWLPRYEYQVQPPYQAIAALSLGDLNAAGGNLTFLDKGYPPIADISNYYQPGEATAEGFHGKGQYFYVVQVREGRRRYGRPSKEAAIDPAPVLKEPTGLKVENTEKGVKLSWDPAKVDCEGNPWEEEVVYQVFRDLLHDEDTTSGEPWAKTQKAGGYDQEVGDGDKVQYYLRACTKDGKRCSEPSEKVAIRYRDLYPPAVPRKLTGTVQNGQVMLIWDAVKDADLGGYFVYRREAGGSWLKLNDAPLVTTAWEDAYAAMETAYEYAVSSVDTAETRNESERSELWKIH